jgi:DNA repair protein RadC
MLSFSGIINKLLKEHGAAALANTNLSALLLDYAQGEYKNDCRLFLHLVASGFLESSIAHYTKDELPSLLQMFCRELCETYFVANEEAQRMAAVMLLCTSYKSGEKENPAHYFARAGYE